MHKTSWLALAERFEEQLVAANLRGMQPLRQALPSGYLARAAEQLLQVQGRVLIGTGFPVLATFETDGPAGAIALYRYLEQQGVSPTLVCGEPLFGKLQSDFSCLELPLNDIVGAESYSRAQLEQWQPELVLSIERPGLAADNRYYNMRGEDISPRCGCFDYFVSLASCPTIAIGDGGNEIGMGNVYQALAQLPITPSVTAVDELVIADVSNWAAYALVMLCCAARQQRWQAYLPLLDIFTYLSAHGSVDGVSRRNEHSEDNQPLAVTYQLLEQLDALIHQHDSFVAVQ
jgi:hypothetical protein